MVDSHDGCIGCMGVWHAQSALLSPHSCGICARWTVDSRQRRLQIAMETAGVFVEEEAYEEDPAEQSTSWSRFPERPRHVGPVGTRGSAALLADPPSSLTSAPRSCSSSLARADRRAPSSSSGSSDSCGEMDDEDAEEEGVPAAEPEDVVMGSPQAAEPVTVTTSRESTREGRGRPATSPMSSPPTTQPAPLQSPRARTGLQGNTVAFPATTEATDAVSAAAETVVATVDATMEPVAAAVEPVAAAVEPVAAAAGPATAAPEPAPVLEIFRTAAARCQREWPEAESREPASPQDGGFQGLKAPPHQRRLPGNCLWPMVSRKRSIRPGLITPIPKS